jgi:acetyltransferase-like isoleucine patch superfamily enzyme
LGRWEKHDPSDVDEAQNVTKYDLIVRLATAARLETALRLAWLSEYQRRGITANVVFNIPPSETLKVEAGSFSYSTTPVDISNVSSEAKVSIGKFCSIGANLVLITSGGHNPQSISNYDYPNAFFNKPLAKKTGQRHANPKRIFERGNVTILNDVWIGQQVIVLGPSTIGNGAVIGAGSVVTKDIGSFEVWAGNPARKLGKRFDDNLCQEIEELEWWNLPEEALIQNLNKVLCSDISEALTIIRRLRNDTPK